MDSCDVDQEYMTALKPIAIAYLACYPLMVLALCAIWYFGLRLSISLLFLCIWSVHKEVYALVVMRRLAELSSPKARR